MIHRVRRQRRQFCDINVVPYVDVMLVLLVIFMVTTPLLQAGVKVSLPKAAAKQMPPTDVKPLVVSINKKGQFFCNKAANTSKPLKKEALFVLVKRAILQNRHLKVYVRGDEHVAYGDVVKAMVLLQKAGAKGVGLVTKSPNVKKA